MTKTKAVLTLLTEHDSHRVSNTAARRIRYACSALGVEDYTAVFAWMGYCRPDTGEPFSEKIERIW